MPTGDFPPPEGMRWTDAAGWVRVEALPLGASAQGAPLGALPQWSPEEIRQVRARFGKAKDFARFVGITPEHLSRLEHGARPPSRTLARLFSLLSQGEATR